MPFRIVALLGLLSFLALRAAGAPPPIAAASVQGVLQSGDFLGAPGNGDDPKTDRVETTYYLQLPAPLAKQLRGASELSGFSAAAQGASYVQLTVFDEEQSVARTLVGKRVRVLGTLAEPDGGTRHTPAVVQVKSMTAIRDWQW
jgi:hypothetical protein